MSQDTEEKIDKKTFTKVSLFKSKEELKFKDKIKNFFLRFFAIGIWVYALTKIFFIDLDTLLFQAFLTDYTWILNFRFIIFLVVFVLTWQLIGAKEFIFWTIYVVFYPLIIFLLKIPFFIWKQKSWVLGFSVLNFIISFFNNLKYGLSILALFLASFAFLTVSSDNVVLYTASAVLLFLTIIVFVKSFIVALKPSKIFYVYSKISNSSKDFSKKHYSLDDSIKLLDIGQLSETQMAKRTEGLQNSVVFNRICLLLSKKLKTYQLSDWRILPSMLSLMFILFFTVICFFGCYYGLYKINPAYFNITGSVSWFDFFYFSFNNLIFGQIEYITPGHWLTQTVAMIQYTLSLFIPIFLGAILFSHRTQKQSLELDEVIESLNEDAQEMESFITKEYGLNSLDDAIKHLLELNSSLSKFIQIMTKMISGIG